MADGGAIPQAFDLHAIAVALRRHKSAVERRASREAWPFNEEKVRGGRRRLFALATLPPDVQAALVIRDRRANVPAHSRAGTWSKSQIEAAWERFGRVSAERKDTATKRQRALIAVESLVRSGTGLMQARAIVAEQLQRDGEHASVPSLGRWAKTVEGCPRDTWIAALVDDYAGRTATAEVPSRAWEMFKADYLRPEAPTATSCYYRLRRVAEKEGMELPSLRTFERKLERELSRQAVVLAREGIEALNRTFPAQTRNRAVFAALEGVNADGHKFDVFVKFPDGTVGRPILLGVQDLYSGKLLGYRVAQTESSDLVRLAFSDVVRNYGIPLHAWLDNGRAFASKLITGGTPNRYRFKVREEDPTGILTGLGITIHWTQPFHGQAKPIERAWRDLCDTIAKHPAFSGAYTGNKPDAKPENYASRAVDHAQFVRVLNEEIAAHNARIGRKAATCAGRSFDATFAESYANTTIRRATPEQLRIMLLASDVVTANSENGSVHLAGNRYWNEALVQHAGQKLMLRFDPDNLHAPVGVYTLANTFLCEAECRATVGFADTNAGREHARAKKQYRRAAKQMLDAERRMDVAELAAQLPAPAPETLPDPKVIAPLFNKPSKSLDAVRRTGTDDATSAQETQLGDFLERYERDQRARSLDRKAGDL